MTSIRQQQINVITSLIAEFITAEDACDPEAFIDRRDRLERINADGWTVDVDLSGDGQRWTRCERVVLTPAELGRAWRLAEDALLAV